MGLTVPGPSADNSNIAMYQAAGTNYLNKFVSYNCLFTLACLDKSSQNAGKFNKSNISHIIARSQGDWGPSNKRVQSEFGQFDYFIDDLIIVSQPALSGKTGESFATKITFKVTEPYSMGLFLDTMLVGAQQGGYGNFREASYLLMIEFAGYTDDNKPHDPDPNLTRYIPIKFIDVHLKVTSAGSVYECEVIPYNELAFRSPTSDTKVPMMLEGATVQEMLVTGPKSLNQAIKDFYQTLKKDKEMTATDEVEIIFPEKFNDKGDTGTLIKNSALFKDFNNNGSVRFPNQDDVHDAQKQIFKDSNVTIKENKVFQFNQGTKIQNIIKDVIIRSDYILNQLTNDVVKTNIKGMINWFRIEIHIEDKDENATTNRQNRKIIYRVLPYEVHISKLLPPNTIPVGYDNLKKTVNRVYDYVYTGKNTEIISVDLDFNMAFFSKLSADAGGKTGTDNPGQRADAARRQAAANINPANTTSSKDHQPAQEIAKTNVKNDPGGSDNDASAQVKNYREMLTSEGDLIEIKMTIRGDPYYLPSSGMGNQIKQPAGDNVMADGSMNYQSGEVDIVLNFRTPIDLDPATGFYKFHKQVDQFSGLFQVFEVESRFNQNKFTQTITAQRRRTQLRGSGEKAVALGIV